MSGGMDSRHYRCKICDAWLREDSYDEENHVCNKKAKMSTDKTDEELINLYVNAIKSLGNPPSISQYDQRDQANYVSIDSVSYGDIRKIVKFVRALRALIWMNY